MRRPWWHVSRRYATKAIVLAALAAAMLAYHLLGGPSSLSPGQ